MGKQGAYHVKTNGAGKCWISVKSHDIYVGEISESVKVAEYEVFSSG